MKTHVVLLLVVLARCNAFAQEVAPGSGLPLPQVEREASQSCRPNYPAKSKRNGEQGIARVGVFVEATGVVSKIEILSSTGYSSLDRAALDYAGCLKFKPGMVDEVPVAMWRELPITFQLDVSTPTP